MERLLGNYIEIEREFKKHYKKKSYKYIIGN